MNALWGNGEHPVKVVGWGGEETGFQQEQTSVAENLLAADLMASGGRKCQFSLRVQSLGDWPHSSRWSHSQEYTGCTSWTQWEGWSVKGRAGRG